jgi:hypothetical protein
MKLLLALVLVTAVIYFMGRRTRERMGRGPSETDLAIRKMREARRKRHGD